MISAFVGKRHSDWDTHLQKLALTLRTMARDSLGCSSDILNLGRQIRLPIDRQFQLENGEKPDPLRIAEWLPVELKELRNFVLKNMNIAYKSRKKFDDKKRQPCKFKVGDKVLLRTHTLSNAEEKVTKKLCKKWCGPFVITREVTPGLTFELKHEDSDISIGVHHVYHFRPYFHCADQNRVNVWTERKQQSKKSQGESSKVNVDLTNANSGNRYNLRKRKTDNANRSNGNLNNFNFLSSIIDYFD